jgi:hypothetical protein
MAPSKAHHRWWSTLPHISLKSMRAWPASWACPCGVGSAGAQFLRAEEARIILEKGGQGSRSARFQLSYT